jgi:glucose/arabinose dehydrogenase
VLIEDRDGDGRSDKTTIFADGLMIPTGLEVAAGGLIRAWPGTAISQNTDGDGKADERRVVLRGLARETITTSIHFVGGLAVNYG